MNIQVLKTEITTDPLSRGYGAMAHTQLADSLNAKNISVKRFLRHPELTRVLAQNGRLAKLRRGAEQWNDPTKDLVTSICMIALGFINRDDSHLDPNSPSDLALINALITAGIFTIADRQAFLDAATYQISRAEQLGLGHVKVGHIIEARKP